MGLDQGTSSGIRDCKSHLLMTPYGQTFLDSLIKHLPEAYLHTFDFWLRMVEPLIEWAATAIFECCQQLGLPERAAAINVGPIVRMFETEPETLRRSRLLPAKDPWFMPVLREASQILRQPPKSLEGLPAWDAPLFPLFPLEAMVTRSIQKAFRKELREKAFLGLSSGGEPASSAPTLVGAASGSGGEDALKVATNQPKDSPAARSAMASPLSVDQPSSPHSQGSEDPVSDSDPSI